MVKSYTNKYHSQGWKYGFAENYAYIYTLIYACVPPAPRPISWIGKAGAGVFSDDGKVAGNEDYVMIIFVLTSNIRITSNRQISVSSARQVALDGELP